MKKALLLLICMSLSIASYPQKAKLNSHGEKMVSRLCTYGKRGEVAKEFTFSYDAECKLTGMVCNMGNVKFVFERKDNQLSCTAYHNGVRDEYSSYEFKMDDHGNISEALTYDYNLNGTGQALVTVNEYEYEYYNGRFRLVSLNNFCMFKEKGQPREEWIYDGNVEEHQKYYFEYPDGNFTYLWEVGLKHRILWTEAPLLSYEFCELRDDTNLNLIVMLFKLRASGDCIECYTEWARIQSCHLLRECTKRNTPSFRYNYVYDTNHNLVEIRMANYEKGAYGEDSIFCRLEYVTE